jgi:hypothetical protein
VTYNKDFIMVEGGGGNQNSELLTVVHMENHCMK